jgi:DNA-binding transcriptional MocR family regulator
MRKQHHIRLTPAQRAEVQAVLDRGQSSALQHRHARILLAAEERPGRRVRADRDVADRCGVSARTVARVRQRLATEGLAVALSGRPHPGAAPKLVPAQELRLVALACSPPPVGHARWSVRLLSAAAGDLAELPPIGRELVRTTLKKTGSSRGGCGDG